MSRKPDTPTPTQEKALRLALDGGALRRLAGGFWTNAKHPEIKHGETPNGEWVDVQTLRACERRGWLTLIKGNHGFHDRAEMTPAGCAAIGEEAPSSEAHHSSVGVVTHRRTLS